TLASIRESSSPPNTTRRGYCRCADANGSFPPIADIRDRHCNVGIRLTCALGDAAPRLQDDSDLAAAVRVPRGARVLLRTFANIRVAAETIIHFWAAPEGV